MIKTKILNYEDYEEVLYLELGSSIGWSNVPDDAVGCYYTAVNGSVSGDINYLYTNEEVEEVLKKFNNE